MRATAAIRFLRQNAIALLALFVALGGTGYAAAGSGGGNVKTAAGPPTTRFIKGSCQAGKVAGYATINGGAAKFPASYTSSNPYLVRELNCSLRPVQVRRAGTGLYVVKFPGTKIRLGFGNVVECPEVIPHVFCLYTNPRTVSVSWVARGPDAGSFQVLVRDSVTGAPADAVVDVLLP